MKAIAMKMTFTNPLMYLIYAIYVYKKETRYLYLDSSKQLVINHQALVFLEIKIVLV